MVSFIKRLHGIVTVSLYASLGGEICIVGGRWVVNTSGGLESKGIYILMYVTHIFIRCCIS